MFETLVPHLRSAILDSMQFRNPLYITNIIIYLNPNEIINKINRAAEKLTQNINGAISVFLTYEPC